MKKSLILILIMTALLSFGCTKPEAEAEPETPVESSPEIVVPETVEVVDTTNGKDDGLYYLVQDSGRYAIYEGMLEDDLTLTASQSPTYIFPSDIIPLYIDYSNLTDTLLIQTEHSLYRLKSDFDQLTDVGEIPENAKGKILQSTYQEDHLFYALDHQNDQTVYVVDSPMDNSTTMDLFWGDEMHLIDVSEDTTTFVYESKSQYYVNNIASGIIEPLPQESLISGEVSFGEKLGAAVILKCPVLASDSPVDEQDAIYDLVIKNGIIFEPESQTIQYGFDIGIKDDLIAIITSDDLTADEMIDATGLVVAPGFIDMLSFNPNYIGAKYKIGDGVTTNLSMHGCTNNFDDFFSYYERNPVMVNYGGAVFMYLVRLEAGLGRYTEPTQAQVDFIAQRTREEIEAGGLALAFSPEYYPGTNEAEIEEAIKVATEYDLASHFHARYSSLVGEKTSIDSVIEILGYARKLDAHVHFMHLHSTGGTGCMEEALEMIQAARDDGYHVTFDIYPYDSWATNIGSARFDGDWQNQFGISYEDLQIAGTTDFVTPENFQQLRNDQRIVVAYAMDNAEVIMALQDPQSMLGSDSIVTSDPSYNHFRASGAFTRFLGYYVRDLDIMPLMEGIRKTSYYTAHQLEDISEDMKIRGRLKEGVIADITIFDYSRIIDTSSAEVPASLAQGIEYVLVSGHVVKDPDRIYTDRRYGQPIANDLR